jgi:hypothetical protein
MSLNIDINYGGKILMSHKFKSPYAYAFMAHNLLPHEVKYEMLTSKAILLLGIKNNSYQN